MDPETAFRNPHRSRRFILVGFFKKAESLDWRGGGRTNQFGWSGCKKSGVSGTAVWAWQISSPTHYPTTFPSHPLFKDLHHKVYVPSSELGLPQPLFRPRVCPSPRTGGRGGHTRLRVRGWGSPNSDDLRKSLALCLHCDLHSAIIQKYSCLVANLLILLRLGQTVFFSGISSLLYLSFLCFFPAIKNTPDFQIVLPGEASMVFQWRCSLFNLRSFDLSLI